jgi:hypothetical protein
LRRRIVMGAALLTAALGLSAAAWGAAPVTLRVNDEFAVKKSHMLCAVEISKTLVPGKKLVACFVVANPTAGPAPKTYSVALAVNGEAVLAKVGAGGQITIVKKFGGRPGPSARPLGRKGELFKVGVGAALAVKSSAIRCGVTTQKFGGKKAKTVGCFKVGANGKPRPNSYGIGITDGGAFIVHFDANSKGSPVEVVQHGK